MPSTRTKLTAAYAAALVATIPLFAGALWLGRGPAVERALARPRQLAASVLLILEEAEARDGLYTLQAVPKVDSVTGVEMSDTAWVLSGRLRARLDNVGEYIVLIDQLRNPVYVSARVRADETAFLGGIPGVRPGQARAAIIPLRGDYVWSAIEPFADARGRISHVVVGIEMRPMMLDIRALVAMLVLVAPFVLLVAIVGAYMIAGGALRPIERIMGDLEAITDGKSLHRRLPVSGVPDELARLAVTLNAMLSRLETSFDALRRFTADASHELKTPLTVLRADVERAMHPTVPDDERLVALEEALQETARMADLVEGLLTLARADEGRFDLHREPIDLEPVVRDVFETAHILGEDAGLTVALTAVEEARVMGDPVRLRQLFLNLITNAIKYTPAPGRVEISLSNRLDGVTFTVRDTGIGIAAADLPHVFDRFFRADRARTRRVQGSDGTSMDGGGFGLGLAISQWIARAHGGTLTATSRLGRGSTFVVSLPIDESSAPTAESETRDAAATPGRGEAAD